MVDGGCAQSAGTAACALLAGSGLRPAPSARTGGNAHSVHSKHVQPGIVYSVVLPCGANDNPPASARPPGLLPPPAHPPPHTPTCRKMAQQVTRIKSSTCLARGAPPAQVWRVRRGRAGRRAGARCTAVTLTFRCVVRSLLAQPALRRQLRRQSGGQRCGPRARQAAERFRAAPTRVGCSPDTARRMRLPSSCLLMGLNRRLSRQGEAASCV